MTCFHPIRALIVGEKEDGKKELKFVGKNFENKDYFGNQMYEEVLLPCGKCIGCTVDRSRQWANRMMMELQYHEKACFITLTYNDENLPLSGYNDSAGNWHETYSLAKSDFQKFMKRLRRHYEPQKIRYFACGEYGSRTRRPHYHAILFGVDFSEDRKPFEKKDGFVTYVSPTLAEKWSDPDTGESFGYHLITDVNWNTCAYVSRYCTKKFYGEQNIYYQTLGIVPEFVLMSRRPGIGARYFEEHGDEVYINQEIFLHNNKGGFKTKPPKYFDKLYEKEHPNEMEEMKEERKRLAEEAMIKKLSETELDLYEQLEVEEREFRERIKSLRRDKL